MMNKAQAIRNKAFQLNQQRIWKKKTFSEETVQKVMAFYEDMSSLGCVQEEQNTH
jgi:hypothetical protein